MSMSAGHMSGGGGAIRVASRVPADSVETLRGCENVQSPRGGGLVVAVVGSLSQPARQITNRTHHRNVCTVAAYGVPPMPPSSRGMV